MDNDLDLEKKGLLPGWIHVRILMNGGGIDIDPSGDRARAGLPRQHWLQGYYENENIRENSRWMIKKLHWNVTVYISFEAGWIKIPLLGLLCRKDAGTPTPHFHPYPSGYHLPYHFKHPITGA